MPKIDFPRLLQTPVFKRSSLFLGLIFILFSGFITYNPEPFLRLGYFGVFVFNLFGPGTILIPTLARHMNIWLLALLTAAGMAFNDSLSWYIGRNGDMLFPKSSRTRRIEEILKKHGVLGLFFWALIPFPYDFIGAVAGYLGISYPKFFFPTFLGRFIRLIIFGFSVVSVFGKIVVTR